MKIDLEPLWQFVAEQPHVKRSQLHGLGHWRRVARNGEVLARRTGADPYVVELFAIFHDSRRENDNSDPQHGARGAAYAASLRGLHFELDDERMALLEYACIWHTDGKHHADPTIGTCWDADRLDIGRVGFPPGADFMSTAFGQEIARAGTIYPFL